MTTANKITIGRILLVPFFIGRSFITRAPARPGIAWGLCLTFAFASLGDAVDGYVARHFISGANWAQFSIRWRTNYC